MHALLSEYLENTLSARQMWEVEKHLAECKECSTEAHQLQQTIYLLRTAEVFDTSNDFMAKLHARLDGLEPEPIRRTPLTTLREWAAGLRERVRIQTIPALSFGMASVGLIALLITGIHSDRGVYHGTTPPPAAPEAVTQVALDRHVAVTASDPFDDPVAAKLEADSNNGDANLHSGVD
jgi:anti-sigma factor RsiW